MKRSVTPEMLIKNSAQAGREIDLETAEKVLELMYNLSELSVKTEIELASRNKKFSRGIKDGNGARTPKSR
jgi:hypothetical protein